MAPVSDKGLVQKEINAPVQEEMCTPLVIGADGINDTDTNKHIHTL